ncbi:MAG TPA: DUF488 domain-containing protein [Gaiellaceae bacterium]|nr:DUF488 domain-containing protein [Gaiellaceae bacterium]
MRIWTVGHGTRPAEALLKMLEAAGVETLVDVRRYPGSRRNPQYNRAALEATLADAGIGYRHLAALGGRLSGEPGEERFACIRLPAFRSYAARMAASGWQDALASVLAEPAPCVMCAETPWTKCHRRFIAELLLARGHEVLHLTPGGVEPHRLLDEAEVRDGRLFLCGELVA